ncbi:unnamed protein product, partial [Cylicocyclus nassatus]
VAAAVSTVSAVSAAPSNTFEQFFGELGGITIDFGIRIRLRSRRLCPSPTLLSHPANSSFPADSPETGR